MSKRPEPVVRRARNDEERQRKQAALLEAALDVFLQKGFSEARLEDVAVRAGVAKGTIYLYFASKEALFEALVRANIGIEIQALEAQLLASDLPTEEILRAAFRWFRTQIIETRRHEIVRLVIAEANRFPELAGLWHREVVSRGIRIVRRIAERAHERGEFDSEELVRFPQLVIAPALVALLWTDLFGRFDPLDVDGLLDSHLRILMRAMRRRP